MVLGVCAFRGRKMLLLFLCSGCVVSLSQPVGWRVLRAVDVKCCYFSSAPAALSASQPVGWRVLRAAYLVLANQHSATRGDEAEGWGCVNDAISYQYSQSSRARKY